MKKKIMVGLVAFTLATGSLLGTTSTVHAQSPFDGFTTMVERIAQKFGLKQEDVQSVVTQVQTERQTARQAEMSELLEAKLSIDVNKKKITEAQKKLILAKHKELQASNAKKMDTWRDLSPEERRTKMQEQRDVLEAWAKQNGIDSTYISIFGSGKGFGRGNGERGMGGWMMK